MAASIRRPIPGGHGRQPLKDLAANGAGCRYDALSAVGLESWRMPSGGWTMRKQLEAGWAEYYDSLARVPGRTGIL